MEQREPMAGAALDALLAGARGPAPDAAFLERVMADAAAVAAARARPVQIRAARPGWRLRLARLVEPVGGWQGIAGLAASLVAGLWFGIAAPDNALQLAEAAAGDFIGVPLSATDDILAGIELPEI